MTHTTLTDLLAMPGVSEHSELRSRFGFMAYHGGGLEEGTDLIADAAAAACGASYYGVVQPESLRLHIPSTRIGRQPTPALERFLEHVDTVITVHGFGRRPLFTSILIGGCNRALAGHVAGHLRRALPAYDVIDELDRIPTELQGVHADNPVNMVRNGGVQLELPPRVRGSSPLWWDWEHGLTPHTSRLIDGLAAAAVSWAPNQPVAPA